MMADGGETRGVLPCLTVDLDLDLWWMLETFYVKRYKKNPLNPTHPPAVLRLDALHSIMMDQQKLPEEMQNVYKGLKQVIITILHRI